MRFNPFDVSYVEDITGEMLTVLKNVEEGWFVDYKEQALPTQKIAKHLCSFSNQYGGWLFFGVTEKIEGKKKLGTAGDFPGLSLNEIVQLKSNLEDAARQCMQPSPFYETKEIKGPVESLGLPNDRSILIVYIEEGKNPPYIHSSGYIYKRVGSQSGPVPITDKSNLDSLTDKKRKNISLFENMVKHEPVLCKADSNKTYIMMHIFAYPMGRPSNIKTLSFKDFKRITKNYGLINFDNIFSTQDGYIGQHVFDNDPSFQLLSLRHYHRTCSFKATIPVNTHDIDDAAPKNGYHYWDSFVSKVKHIGANYIDVADINPVVFSMMNALYQSKLMLNSIEVDTDVFFKITAMNTWRLVPFFDSSEYIKWIENNGLPVVQDDNFVTPPGFSPSSMMKISNYNKIQESDQIESEVINSLIAPLFLLLKCLGIDSTDNEKILPDIVQSAYRYLK